MKFNKIKNAKETKKPANSNKQNSTSKVIKKKKKFYTQPKEQPIKFKTKVVMPKSGEDVLSNSNWLQMQDLIKNQNESKSVGQNAKSDGKLDKKTIFNKIHKSNKKKSDAKSLEKSANQTNDQINQKQKDKEKHTDEKIKKMESTSKTIEQNLDKETMRKKERFRLKRKLKREHAKLKTGNKKINQVKKTGDKKIRQVKNVKSTEKNELWFEVDQIYLDKAMNPGQPAQPLKDDDLIRKNASTGVTKAIGIDCEMVGVGPNNQSALARISIVNQFGHTIYDKFVLPEDRITDYRTFVSGIRPEHLVNGLHIDIARQEVEDIIRGKLLIGHAVHNDLVALGIKHPKQYIRDTSVYFKKMFNGKIPSLKRLSETLLNVKVQTGEHSSVEDAKATMRLYTLYKKDWESSIAASLKSSKASKLAKQSKT